MIAAAVLLAAARGSIVLLAAAIAATALRSKPAALRHGIWSLAIASQLALPLVALVMPQRSVDFGPLGTAMTRATARLTTVVSAPSARVRAGDSGRIVPQSSQSAAGVARPTEPNSLVVTPDASATLGLVTLLWGAGALLILLRFVVGTILVARETRRASRPVNREWVVLAGQIQEEMDLQRDAVLLWGARRGVPYTWGILSPVVCLPPDADSWSVDRLRIVMIHELAHVQRFDTVGEVIAQLSLVIFWFNPLLWLAVRRMRTEREHACDDRVLTRGVKPSTYVEELVMMMKSLGSGGIAPGFGAIAMARRTQFEARMFAVLNERTDRHTLSRRSIAGIAAAMLVLLLGVASVRPATAAPTGRTPSPLAGKAALKADTRGQPDFDEMVADCNRKQPKFGARFCEVRNVDLSALTGAVDFRGGYIDGVIFLSRGSTRTPTARALVRAEAVTPDDARSLASKVRTFLRAGVLQSEGPGGGRSNLWSVLYEVTVPVGATVKARTELGQIGLRDFQGTADIAAVNGPLQVFGAAGAIKGRTENGPIIVGLGGDRWDGEGLDLQSRNGPIYLSIPTGYSGHLITGTTNGPMEIRYPLMVSRMKNKQIDAELGGGGPTVRVTTINGPAEIK